MSRSVRAGRKTGNIGSNVKDVERFDLNIVIEEKTENQLSLL